MLDVLFFNNKNGKMNLNTKMSLLEVLRSVRRVK